MTGIVKDPYSGLELIELGHVWGHGVPSMPGQLDVRMQRAVKHAQHGVLAWRITTSLHTGTHMNAPIHLIQKGADLAAVSPDRLFGNGAILDVPKRNWEVITAADLEGGRAGDQEGRHRRHRHRLAPQVLRRARVLRRGAGPVQGRGGVAGGDERQDGRRRHAAGRPSAGDLHGPAPRRPADEAPRRRVPGGHRQGPEEGVSRSGTSPTGRCSPPASRPIEQVGGDVDLVKGKRATIAATPWKFEHGDACQVRLVAMFDPSGNCRIEPASDDRGTEGTPDMSLKVYNLSHTFTQFMPEWPSTPSVNINVNKFHAKDGVYEVEWEGIMHRCTHMDAPLHVTENTPSIADYPLWRLFGTGVVRLDPQGQVGRHHARGPGERDSEDRRGRHRHDQHRLPPQVGRHRRVLRLRLRHGRRGRPVAGREEGQDGRLRLPGQRPPDRHQAGRPRPRAETAAPDRGVQGGDRPRPEGGLPAMGAGAQDPHVQGRHPRHRERRAATSTRSPASAARSWRCRGAGRAATAAWSGCSRSSIRSRRSVSRPVSRR